MNRRRVFNKLGKIFMVMTMILSMCFSAVNTKRPQGGRMQRFHAPFS